GIQSAHVTDSQQGLLIGTSLFEDTYGPGYLALDKPGDIEPVELSGAVHEGGGELERFQHIDGDTYLAVFNIDGVSWAYEADFDETARAMKPGRVPAGEGGRAGGGLTGP